MRLSIPVLDRLPDIQRGVEIATGLLLLDQQNNKELKLTDGQKRLMHRHRVQLIKNGLLDGLPLSDVFDSRVSISNLLCDIVNTEFQLALRGGAIIGVYLGTKITRQEVFETDDGLVWRRRK